VLQEECDVQFGVLRTGVHDGVDGVVFGVHLIRQNRVDLAIGIVEIHLPGYHRADE
jgi:hypothetical protein